MAIDVTDVVRITATFAVDGVNTDPTGVTCTTFTPAGVTKVYTYGIDAELTKTATGVYRLQVTVDESGNYFYRWQGSGAVVAREEGSFFVNTPKF